MTVIIDTLQELQAFLATNKLKDRSYYELVHYTYAWYYKEAGTTLCKYLNINQSRYSQAIKILSLFLPPRYTIDTITVTTTLNQQITLRFADDDNTTNL